MAGTSTRSGKYPPARGHSCIIRDKGVCWEMIRNQTSRGDSYLRDMFNQLTVKIWRQLKGDFSVLSAMAAGSLLLLGPRAQSGQTQVIGYFRCFFLNSKVFGASPQTCNLPACTELPLKLQVLGALATVPAGLLAPGRKSPKTPGQRPSTWAHGAVGLGTGPQGAHGGGQGHRSCLALAGADDAHRGCCW